MAGSDKQDVLPSCQQSLCMTFFFDGTGNNLDADIGTNEHSNVARMFLIHRQDKASEGRYAIYIPGVGTYFKDVGDPGGTTRGLAFGAEGDDRLDWAFKQFDEKLAYHVSLAQNPTNKITMIRVALFGFSRGATMARAFARRLEARCRQDKAGWVLQAGGHPIRLTFMGRWDTVASVGMPMSSNNTPLVQSAGWMSTQTAIRNRSTSPDDGIQGLAFGQPGADPAPGPANGHMGWADDIAVTAMPERCVHMIAAHEIRNSFPLDSCQRGGRYQANVQEMVYPGVHSDVGGGYRPGEGARSVKASQMVSLMPLRAMHKEASDAGVPLYPMNAHPDPKVAEYFATDAGSKEDYDEMLALWTHYMNQSGWGGPPLGEVVNSHMRLYYGWRFHNIRLNQAAHAAGKDTADEALLKQEEPGWRKEQQSLQKEMTPAQERMQQAQLAVSRAKMRLANAQESAAYSGQAVDPQLRDDVARAEADAAQPTDDYLKLKARYDTLPGTDGQLARSLAVYDAQLMADAQTLDEAARRNPSGLLRPHYKVLLEAYRAEFTENNGLRDDKTIAFFDHYIHDSLAGFARDATLPSDPRVIYIGSSHKLDYAENERAPNGAGIPA